MKGKENETKWSEELHGVEFLCGRWRSALITPQLFLPLLPKERKNCWAIRSLRTNNHQFAFTKSDWLVDWLGLPRSIWLLGAGEFAFFHSCRVCFILLIYSIKTIPQFAHFIAEKQTPAFTFSFIGWFPWALVSFFGWLPAASAAYNPPKKSPMPKQSTNNAAAAGNTSLHQLIKNKSISFSLFFHNWFSEAFPWAAPARKESKLIKSIHSQRIDLN